MALLQRGESEACYGTKTISRVANPTENGEPIRGVRTQVVASTAICDLLVCQADVDKFACWIHCDGRWLRVGAQSDRRSGNWWQDSGGRRNLGT